MKLKRKEFMVGAAMGLVLAAVATAGGAIDWPAGRLPASASQPYGGRFIQTGGQPIFAPPPGAPLSFADIVERVGPAVVQISTRSRVDTSRLRRIPTIPGLPPGFAVPPGGAEPEVDPEDAPQQLGEGSGFFISADGYIVTNNHVVADAEEIKVKLSDERELTARLIGRDEATDLAVIKVEGDNFSFVTFEEEARPRVGDWVIAIGNPYGFGATVTAGIVSAFGRDLSATGRGSAYNDFIQIDAAINRGNSGGPTFDTYGRVIGVNSQIFSPTGGSVGIGFAIPAETAKSITDQLVRNGRIERGYIGVSVGSVSEEIKESLGLRNNDGAYVSSVTPGGPADRGGVQPDDIITSVNGERVTSSTDLTRRVGAVRPGEAIRLELVRAGRTQTVTIRATVRPAESELNSPGAEGEATPEPEAKPAVPTTPPILGLSVAPLTPALREQYGVPAGQDGVVIVEVQPRTDAARKGFRAGYLIQRADQQPVRTAADLAAAVARVRASGRPSILLAVRSGAQAGPIVLDLDDDRPSGGD